jgi:hypothetical protein
MNNALEANGRANRSVLRLPKIRFTE